VPRPDPPTPPRAAALPPVAAAPAATTDGASFAIQVGAFADERAASGLAKDLQAKGYAAELVAASGGSSRWRVRVQPIRSRTEAESVASRLKRVEGLPTWVMPMEGRSVR
jgi:cell division septation protein DedD